MSETKQKVKCSDGVCWLEKPQHEEEKQVETEGPETPENPGTNTPESGGPTLDSLLSSSLLGKFADNALSSLADSECNQYSDSEQDEQDKSHEMQWKILQKLANSHNELCTVFHKMAEYVE